MSIEEVDALLSTLASRSAFSADCVRQSSASASSLKGRTRAEIIQALYSRLSASEACVVTQIILKDLRPLLYPLPEDEMHYTSLLMHYTSNALEQLSKFDAMRIWDTSGRMLSAYRVRASLDDAALAYEQGLSLHKPRECPLTPKIGTPIQVPELRNNTNRRNSLLQYVFRSRSARKDRAAHILFDFCTPRRKCGQKPSTTASGRKYISMSPRNAPGLPSTARAVVTPLWTALPFIRT